MGEQAEALPLRCTASATVCSFLWTSRVTGCDVISIVTTVEASKGAQMVELPVDDATKASGNKAMAGNFNWGTPLEETAHDRRSKMNQMLRAERDEFMRRLHDKRMRRLSLENAAATRIQCHFRGHSVRSNKVAILERCEVRKRVRAALQQKWKVYGVVVSAKQHSEQRSNARNRAAIRIQSSFRRFAAQNTVQRLRPEHQRLKLLAAITIIQSAFRLWASKNVRIISALESSIESRHAAAIVVQTAVRRHQAILRVVRRRRKLRYIAALTIQCVYRIRLAKRVVADRYSTISTRKRYAGATQFQRLVRGFIARARCERLNATRIMDACVLIQTHMRKFECSRRVAVKRQQATNERRQCSAVVIQRHARGLIDRQRRKDAQLLQQCDALMCASRGDLMGLRDCAELLPDIGHETNADGDNILIVAARQGQLEIVRQGLEWGIDIDSTNAWGETATVAAIKAKQSDVVSYLLAKGCNTDAHGELLLYEAAAAGMTEPLQTLIVAGHDVNIICNDDEETPLFGACQNGMYSTAKLLIECGADVHKRNAEGQTVLHKAASAANQDIQLLQLLLDAGLDASGGTEIPGLPASQAETGRTPFFNAILHGNTSTLQHLKSFTSIPVTADTATAEIGKIVWSDEDIDAAIALCESDQLDLIQHLLSWGLDPNAESSASRDTFILAAARGCAQSVVAELLRQNVRLDAVNDKGRTVLHEACASTNPEITTELVIRMHSLTAKLIGQPDKVGITPLHEAAASGVSVDLIDRTGVEAAVNLPAPHGMTPLMVACLYKHFQVAVSLLTCGADAQVADHHGRTALHYCYATMPSARFQAYATSKHRRLVFPQSDIAVSASPESSSPTRSFTLMRQSVIAQLIAVGCGVCSGNHPVIQLMKFTGDELIILEALESFDSEQAWEVLIAAVRLNFTDLVAGVLRNNLICQKLCQNRAQVQPANATTSMETVLFQNKTLAGWAVESQSLDVLKLLSRMHWRLGALQADVFGNTLLHFASAIGADNALSVLLVQNGVNLERTNNAGLTALAVAVKNGKDRAARVLLSNGANITAGLSVRREAWLLALQKQRPAGAAAVSDGANCEESDFLSWYLYRRSHGRDIILDPQ